MRTFPILIFTLLTSLYASAQTLYDIYLMLPNNVALGDKGEREQMVKNHQTGNKKLGAKLYYRFGIVDEKNGFLNVTGAFEGIWEMCYWNLGNKKLIAVYHQGCGPVCYIEEFKFFVLQNGKIELQEIEDIIPGYKTLYEDFFIDYSDNRKKELKDKDIIATLLFKIPRKGKDIIVLFGNEDSKETYSKFSKGDRMLLRWDNGKFIKDKIFWSK